MSLVTILAEEAQHVQLPLPTWAYGAIALGVFAVLGLIVFNFRDVYHRHAPAEAHATSSGAGHDA